jgi:hypothetical protein
MLAIPGIRTTAKVYAQCTTGVEHQVWSGSLGGHADREQICFRVSVEKQKDEYHADGGPINEPMDHINS